MKTEKLFDFRLIAIGLVFLMDFNVNTIDILPDFIGLALVSLGIGKGFYISDNLVKAKKYINIFYVPALAKFGWNIVYFALDLKKTDASTMLLLTTVASGFELVLGLLVFYHVFFALDNFFHSGDSAKYLKSSESMAKAVRFFMVFKFALSVLPHIPVLLTDDAWDGLSLVFDVYLDAEFVKNLLMPPCFIIQTLTALFLLSIIIPFFFATAKDAELGDHIKARINHELLNNHFMVAKQNLHSAFLLFALGCLFFVDFQVDDINFLPDFAICLLFIPGVFLVLRKNPELKSKKLFAFLSAGFFVSAFAYISGTLYRFSAQKIFSGENTLYLQTLQYISVILYCASAVFLFLAFLEFYSFLLALQRAHLEFSVRYLDRYLTASEKGYDKNKHKIMRVAAVAFCVKILSVVLPESGIVLFFHSMVLLAFALMAAGGLYATREAIYSYYATYATQGDQKN